jgi:hypothetical protein
MIPILLYLLTILAWIFLLFIYLPVCMHVCMYKGWAIKPALAPRPSVLSATHVWSILIMCSDHSILRPLMLDTRSELLCHSLGSSWLVLIFQFSCTVTVLYHALHLILSFSIMDIRTGFIIVLYELIFFHLLIVLDLKICRKSWHQVAAVIFIVIPSLNSLFSSSLSIQTFKHPLISSNHIHPLPIPVVDLVSPS